MKVKRLCFHLLLIGIATRGSSICIAKSGPHRGPAGRGASHSTGRRGLRGRVRPGRRCRRGGALTANGVYIDEDGQRFKGRDAIQKEYEDLFEDNPGLKLSVEINSVRLINATTAIEEGRAAVTPQPPGDTPPVMTHYTAVHVRQDGKWLMADVRDVSVELPPDHGEVEDT